MLVHALMFGSRANGPALRAVVWFQGCTLGCDQCWNPATHAFSGAHVAPERVATEILDHQAVERLDGVTFSGGEPMQQAPALLAIIQELRRRSTPLSLGMFTGYTERELDLGHFSCVPDARLRQKVDLSRAIRTQLDFAVIGRYNQTQPSTEGLCTSRNQRLRLFSGRYREADFASRAVEVVIGADGFTQITGFPVRGIPA